MVVKICDNCANMFPLGTVSINGLNIPFLAVRLPDSNGNLVNYDFCSSDCLTNFLVQGYTTTQAPSFINSGQSSYSVSTVPVFTQNPVFTVTASPISVAPQGPLQTLG